MTDTSLDVQRFYQSLLMSRSGLERLRMGCELFTTAREFVSAAVKQAGEQNLREQFFLRFYGPEFGSAERELIRARIRALSI